MKRRLIAPLLGAGLVAGATLAPAATGTNPSATVPDADPARAGVPFELASAAGAAADPFTTYCHSSPARLAWCEWLIFMADPDNAAWFRWVTGQSGATTTAPAPAPAAPSAISNPIPSGDGMWISSTQLATKPTSGPAWDEVRAAAGRFTSSMTDYTDQDSTDGTHALAAALVYARTGDAAMRTKVADAIQRIASSPYNTSDNPSALGWARTMTAWVVASDLIDLAQLRPQVDEQWRTFLRGMLTHPYDGDGGDHLLDLAVSRANNIGAVARTAVTAIAIYTGDRAQLDQMAQLYRAFVEGSTVHRFDWDKDKDRSWHCNPGDPASYRGINAPCTRDGNDLGGVLAEEYRRSDSYDASDFPGSNTTKYPWETLGAVVVQAELLHRAGYGEALTWGRWAPARALKRLHHLHTVAPDDGWTFGREAGGGSDDRWIIHLVNGLYETGLPEPGATGHGRPMSWTSWTH